MWVCAATYRTIIHKHTDTHSRAHTHNKEKPAALASPGDLALVDVQASLGHVSHAPLRLLGGKRVEVMHVRCLISDLKVTDAAVTLTKRENKQGLRLSEFK